MTSEAFVTAIRSAVYKTAAKGTMEVLEHPPGRRPDAELVRLNQWYRALSPSDRENVTKAVDMAADQATYNFLSVLDGLMAIEPVGTKGRLHLFHDDGKTRTLLNDEDAEQLTMLFKS